MRGWRMQGWRAGLSRAAGIALGAAAIWLTAGVPCAHALKRLGPGDAVPDVALHRAGGGQRLAALLGERGALVVFWASWNPRSAEILRFLAAQDERYGPAGFRAIPINVEREGATVEEMNVLAEIYRGWGVPWPTWFDSGLDAFDAFGVITLPTCVYLDADLRIFGHYPGFPGEARKALPQLIEKGLGIWEPPVAVRTLIEVRYEPQNGAGAVFGMGRMNASRGQPRKAAKHLRDAIRRDPEFPDPLAALAFLAHLQGDQGTVEQVLGELATRAADSDRFLEAYGVALLATGRREQAETALMPLLEREEPHPRGIVALAWAQAARGDTPGADALVARLGAWPLGGIALEIDVAPYLDPTNQTGDRWQDTEGILLRLLGLQ